MKKKHYLLAAATLLSCLVALNACKKKKTEDEIPVVEPKIAEAKIIPVDKSGVTGLATFTEIDGKVTLKVSIAHAAPGEHGIHLHVGGDCSVGDKTNIAGGHWNPTGSPHGEWGAAAGFHRGDIGNITIGSDSSGTKDFSTDLWALGGTDTVKNILNHAILGNRLACGEIKLK
jgi:superoxide dismutase, Cu-Zn family